MQRTHLGSLTELFGKVRSCQEISRVSDSAKIGTHGAVSLARRKVIAVGICRARIAPVVGGAEGSTGLLVAHCAAVLQLRSMKLSWRSVLFPKLPRHNDSRPLAPLALMMGLDDRARPRHGGTSVPGGCRRSRVSPWNHPCSAIPTECRQRVSGTFFCQAANACAGSRREKRGGGCGCCDCVATLRVAPVASRLARAGRNFEHMTPRWLQP